MSTSATADLRLARLRLGWVVAGVAAVALVLTISVAVGPVSIGVGSLACELTSHMPIIGTGRGLTAQQATIVWELRLPRVVLALLVGAMLASAGATYQGVFRNPLADPYLLGAAAGAGLAQASRDDGQLGLEPSKLILEVAATLRR